MWFLLVALLLMIPSVLPAQKYSLRDIRTRVDELRIAGELDAAERVLRETLAASEEHLFAQDRIQLMLMLATVQLDRGDYEAARLRFERLASDRTAHPDFVARAHTGVLIARLRANQSRSAKAYLERKVASDWPRLRGSVSPEVSANLAAWMALTEALQEEKESARAFAVYAREILTEEEARLSPDLSAETWALLADLAILDQKWEDAIQALEMAIGGVHKAFGENSPAAVPYLATLAELQLRMGKQDAGLRYAEDAWIRTMVPGTSAHSAFAERACQVYLDAMQKNGQFELRKQIERHCSSRATSTRTTTVEFGALQK